MDCLLGQHNLFRKNEEVLSLPQARMPIPVGLLGKVADDGNRETCELVADIPARFGNCAKPISSHGRSPFPHSNKQEYYTQREISLQGDIIGRWLDSGLRYLPTLYAGRCSSRGRPVGLSPGSGVAPSMKRRRQLFPVNRPFGE